MFCIFQVRSYFNVLGLLELFNGLVICCVQYRNVHMKYKIIFVSFIGVKNNFFHLNKAQCSEYIYPELQCIEKKMTQFTNTYARRPVCVFVKLIRSVCMNNFQYSYKSLFLRCVYYLNFFEVRKGHLYCKLVSTWW